MYSCTVLTEHVSDVLEMHLMMVLVLEMVQYFLILAFTEPNDPSNRERY